MYSHENKQSIRHLHESLRFSADSNLSKDDNFSISTDGPDIQFIFQDEHNEPFHFESQPPAVDSKDRRKKLFSKYKQAGEGTAIKNQNDIMESFDEIFHLKENSNHSNTPPSEKSIPQEKEQEQKKEAPQNTKQVVLPTSESKENAKKEISTKEQVSKGSQKELQHRQSIQTRPSNSSLAPPPAMMMDLRPRTPKVPVKVSFNYQNSQTPSLQEQTQHSSMKQLNKGEQKVEAPISNRQEMKSHPVFQQEQRVAKFLKKVKKMNSIYPNFAHPLINLEMESKYCQVLSAVFEEALNTLENIAKKVFRSLKQPRQFPQELFRLDVFLYSGWERAVEVPQVDKIKPLKNFKQSPINEQKLFEALKNYRDVIIYYKNYTIKNIEGEEGQKYYWKIRQKFWKLESNIRSISEDVYRTSLSLGYPAFFYEYLVALRAPHPKLREARIANHHKQILTKLIQNRQKNEPLSCSEVGQSVKIKLQRQLKFLHPF